MEVSGKISGDVLSASLLHASDDDVQLYCEPCDRDGSRVPANGYCQDCAEHLCDTCYKVHLKPAPSRNHVLLDSSKMPQSQQLRHLSTPADLTENCQLHGGKYIEYVCRDHNILGCSPCIIMNHRNCKIDYIPDASTNYDTSQEYQNLLDTLNTIHTSCKYLAQSVKENKKKIQENQDAIKEEIMKFRQKINRILDNWETEAVGKVDQLFLEESVRVDSIDAECSKSAKEVEDLQNELKELQQSRKLIKLFIKAKENDGKMKDYTTALTKMQESIYIKSATFKYNLSIERIINTETCLGEVTFETNGASHVEMPVEPTHPGIKETRKEAEQSDQQQESANNTEYAASSGPWKIESRLLLQEPLYKLLAEPARLQQQPTYQSNLTYDKLSATSFGEIDIREPDDTGYCGIRGIAVVSRDHLAVTDNNNSKVKLVDTVQYKVVSSLKMSSPPWDVAAMPGDQLAVTLPGSFTVQILSVSDGLSKVRQVEVGGQCWGLAFSNGHFVVGFSEPGKVQIMTSDGKVLNTIQYDKALFLLIKKMFVYPRYATVDENNKAIYVSDAHSEGRGITRLNLQGEVTGVYKESKLSAPYGMLVLADGSLLVCHYRCNTIQLVSPDFTQSRTILQKKDGLSYPQSVALDTEQKTLYVGGFNSNNLLLYEMK